MNDPAQDSLAAFQLAAFQAALLTLLAEPLPPEEMLRRLRTDPAFASYREYVASFEPRMVEVAGELVKKWGRGAGESAPETPGLQDHLG